MVRWVRLALAGIAILAILAVGVSAGLFLVANAGWVDVAVPPWMKSVFGDDPAQVWLPALLAGWLLSALVAAALLIWSMYYVWRRRQYETLIARLEGELADLRNLPFENPAPLEDLPERPDERVRDVLDKVSRQIAPDAKLVARSEQLGHGDEQAEGASKP